MKSADYLSDSGHGWSPSIHRYIWVYDSAHFPARKVRVCQVCIKKHNDVYLAQGCPQIK